MNLQPWIFARKNFKHLLKYLIVSSLNFFRQFRKTSESAEYKAWRDRFILKRIKFCLWLAFPCLLTYTLFDFYDSDFSLRNRWVEANLAALVFLSINSSFYRTKWGRNHLKYLFICISLGITCFPPLWMILRGSPTPSAIALNMVFITQTVFVPFFWGLHLISQLLALTIYSASVHLRGSLPNIMLYENLSAIYWFWICFICTTGVYFYERLQQQEFESRRELNVFLHSVSHDLRAPVMGTSIVLQNLLKKAQTSNGKIAIDGTILAKLLQGSDRQLKMINSLLEAQSTASLGIKLNCQPCHLTQLIASILAELEPILEQNEVVVKNKITSDLPLINADSLQLWRVLNNLITNAIQHNPDGIEITVDAVIETEFIRIYIIDNGIGIAPEQQARLFELYARGDRARYMPGLGMGLYLCQQIIVAHGGEIGCDSHPGMGSSFWFTLPKLN
jgi:signal transduction histidine kinase